MTVEYDVEKLIVSCEQLTNNLCEVVKHLDLPPEQRRRLSAELAGVSGAIDEFLRITHDSLEAHDAD